MLVLGMATGLLIGIFSLLVVKGGSDEFVAPVREDYRI